MSETGKKIKTYAVQKTLGRGGMGIVYLARDERLNRQVALKVLHLSEVETTALERFIREAQLVARLPHEAIVPVLDASLDHSPPFVVYRLMTGGDLEDVMREGPCPQGRVAQMGARLARALAHLHEHGIIHRDVKPANVLLDEKGDGYIADLGLVQDEGAETLTKAGFVVGTPRYMAPEILEQAAYSPSTDVYALGLTLIELARGAPMRGMTLDMKLVQSSLRQRIAHQPLRAALMRAVRQSRGSRYPDALEFAEDLEVCVAEIAATGGTLEFSTSASASVSLDQAVPEDEEDTIGPTAEMPTPSPLQLRGEAPDAEAGPAHEPRAPAPEEPLPEIDLTRAQRGGFLAGFLLLATLLGTGGGATRDPALLAAPGTEARAASEGWTPPPLGMRKASADEPLVLEDLPGPHSYSTLPGADGSLTLVGEGGSLSFRYTHPSDGLPARLRNFGADVGGGAAVLENEGPRGWTRSLVLWGAAGEVIFWESRLVEDPGSPDLLPLALLPTHLVVGIGDQVARIRRADGAVAGRTRRSWPPGSPVRPHEETLAALLSPEREARLN